MSWDPYGYYNNGYPPPQPQPPYYAQPPPAPSGYPYGAPPPPAAYPPYGHPPPAAPAYGGYWPPPPSHAAPPQHQPVQHSPPPPPPPREGELRPPPDVGVDPNSFRRFFSQQLQGLTYNSKPVITALTLFAHEHSVRMGAVVAQCLDEHLRSCPPAYLLPTFYLLDSISKNIGAPYVALFARFLERAFLSAYHSADSSTRTKLEELLGTWKTGGADGGELFRLPGEIGEGREGRVQRGIETALWGAGGRARAGLSATTREGSAGYGNGVAQLPPPSASPRTAAPAPAAVPPPTTASAATAAERSGVLYDVRRLLALRQEQLEANPGDAINQTQIGALRKLESLILNTQLTPDQVAQIRTQLAALTPPAPPPAAPPAAVALPPAAAAALSPPPEVKPTIFSPTPTPQPAPAIPPAAPAAAAPANPLAGIDLSLLSQLSATGALAGLFSGSASGTPQPGGTPQPEETKPVVKAEEPAVKEEKADDAAGLWEGEVMRMAVGMGNADVALARPQAPNILYTLLPLSCQQCGLRLFDSRHGKRKMDQHLDWHFTYKRRIREHAGRTAGRGWFTQEEEWYTSTSSALDASTSASSALAAHASSSFSSAPSSSAPGAPAALDRAALQKLKVPVPAASGGAGAGLGLGDKPCPICQDRFKSEWSDEEEEWVWWNAVVVDGTLYHATCHAETSLARATASAASASATRAASRESTPLLASKKRAASASVSPVKPSTEGDGDGEPMLKRVKAEPGTEDGLGGGGGGTGMPPLEETA